MELRIKPHAITIMDLGKLDQKDFRFSVSVDSDDGSKNENVCFYIQPDRDEDNEAFLAIDINRNQAMYLVNYLKAFLNEIDTQLA